MNASKPTTIAFETLNSKINDRSATIGVIGLGYVGTPLMTTILKSGFRAIGFDISEQRVADFRAKHPYLNPWVLDSLWDFVDAGKAVATTDFGLIKECDVIIVCVPTPLDEHHAPDLAPLKGACDAALANSRPGQLLVIESTSYPGTTEDYVMAPARELGIKLGDEYFVAYSPEREDPGNKKFDTHSIPKVVGADDDLSRDVAEAFYGSIVATVVPVSSIAVAESSKVFENSFRAINIAFVNEMKQVFDRLGIDVWEVVEAAATKPFGFMPFYPGPGIGGHCIPVDPLYLTWRAQQVGQSTKFIDLAHAVNRSMPGFMVEHVKEAIAKAGVEQSKAKVLVVGLAYKKNVGDLRESPSLDVIELLKSEKIDFAIHDPHFDHETLSHYGAVVDQVSADSLKDITVALVLTDHDVVNWAALREWPGYVVDTRNTSQLRGGVCHIVKA